MPRLPSRRVRGYSLLFVLLMAFIAGPFLALKLHGPLNTNAPKSDLKKNRMGPLVYPKPSRDTELRKSDRLDIPTEPAEPVRLTGKSLPTLEESRPSYITLAAHTTAAVPAKVKVIKKKHVRRAVKKAKAK